MYQDLLRKISKDKQNLNYFHILSSLYILGILLSITVSGRLMPFKIPLIERNIMLTAATWVIPFIFFIQDITTEVYGFYKSREIVFLSIPIVIIYIVYLKCTTFFPDPNFNNIYQTHNVIFNNLPRHLLAFLVSFCTGVLANNFVLSKLKKKLKGKFLVGRFILATAVGEAVLQILGTTIAWIGILKFDSEILPFIVFSYFYKIMFEVLMSPLNIIICSLLKKLEGLDVY